MSLYTCPDYAAIESQQDALARTACGIPARREEREE